MAVERLPQIEADKHRASIERLKRILPLVDEESILFAKMWRSRYLACIAEGFTKEEALQLCKL